MRIFTFGLDTISNMDLISPSLLFLLPKSLCRHLLEDREGRQAKRVCLVVCLVALGMVAMPFRPVAAEAPSALRRRPT